MSSRRQRERRRVEKVAFMEKLKISREEQEKNERLESLTKAELIEYAEYNGIKIDKSAKKADILAKIKE